MYIFVHYIYICTVLRYIFSCILSFAFEASSCFTKKNMLSNSRVLVRYTEVSPKTMMKGKSKQATDPSQIELMGQ